MAIKWREQWRNNNGVISSNRGGGYRNRIMKANGGGVMAKMKAGVEMKRKAAMAVVRGEMA